MDQTTPPDIKAILTEMAALTTMERGKLTAEYRRRPASAGTDAGKLGPYYKLQAWEEGRNASRRVAPQEVPALQEDLANHERFTQLAVHTALVGAGADGAELAGDFIGRLQLTTRGGSLHHAR